MLNNALSYITNGILLSDVLVGLSLEVALSRSCVVLDIASLLPELGLPIVAVNGLLVELGNLGLCRQERGV